MCINITSVPYNKLRHRKTTNYKRQSIDSILKYLFRKNYMSRNNSRIVMFLCTTVQYAYMNLLRNDVSNLFVKKVGRGTKYSFANNSKPASTPLQRDTHWKNCYESHEKILQKKSKKRKTNSVVCYQEIVVKQSLYFDPFFIFKENTILIQTFSKAEC